MPSVRSELDDQRAGAVGAGLVELAGRLIGEQQRRPVGEGSAQREPLALATRQLPGQRVSPAKPSAVASSSSSTLMRRSRLGTPRSTSGSMTASRTRRSGLSAVSVSCPRNPISS